MVQSCSVSYVDSDGFRHSVEVRAGSLYEAAVLAARAFHEHRCPVPSMLPLEIEVAGPIVRHSLTLAKVESWLESSAKRPADLLAKQRLKELLPK